MFFVDKSGGRGIVCEQVRPLASGGPGHFHTRLGKREIIMQRKQAVALARKAGEGWGEGRRGANSVFSLHPPCAHSLPKDGVRIASNNTEF
jgi:hypothetical protein